MSRLLSKCRVSCLCECKTKVEKHAILEVRVPVRHATNMEDSASKLTYSGKTILAPMVRIGTLPTRLLALRYGADIVYTEELIDWKLLRCVRRVNDILGTVDYIDKSDGIVVFRTCVLEKNRVVLQVGTANHERALKVAKFVEKDVAGIDINMGCPKEFSIKGGMGAALMANVETAKLILTTLVQNLSIPVTCKVRVLESVEDSIKLCQTLEATGITAIGVHGRTRDERPRHTNRNETIKAIAEALSIPVIANGGSKEIEKYEDIDKFRRAAGCSSVMIARSAQWNVSIFRPSGLIPLDSVIEEYLRLCVDFDNNASNSKYCVQIMLRELVNSPKGKIFQKAQTLEEICAVWEVGQYCRERQKYFKERGLKGRMEVYPEEDCVSSKKRKLDDDASEELKEATIESVAGEADVILKVQFFRSEFRTDADLPKSRLLTWSKRQGFNVPCYTTQQQGRLFRSVAKVGPKTYTSTVWEKSKRWAEQGAALVCLLSHGLMEHKNDKGVNYPGNQTDPGNKTDEISATVFLKESEAS